MAIFKRLTDVAKSNLDALQDRLSGGDLSSYTDEELLAELEHRRRQRRTAAERRKGAEPASAPTESSPPSPAPAPTEVGERAPAAPPRDELARAYASLEVERDADLETVKRAYRKLIRRYHPDRHAGDPEKHRLALELAQKLTKAYMRVRAHLEQPR